MGQGENLTFKLSLGSWGLFYTKHKMKIPSSSLIFVATLFVVQGWTKEEKKNIKKCRAKARKEQKDGFPKGPSGGKRLRLHCENSYKWQFMKGYCPPYCLEASEFKSGANLDLKYCSKSPLQRWVKDGNVLRPAWNKKLCVKMGKTKKRSNRENAPSVLTTCSTELKFVSGKTSNKKRALRIADTSADDIDIDMDIDIGLRRLPQIDKKYHPKKFNGDGKGKSHFEIQYKGMCFTNPHHPKECEPVNWEPCENARNSKTNYWRWEK